MIRRQAPTAKSQHTAMFENTMISTENDKIKETSLNSLTTPEKCSKISDYVTRFNNKNVHSKFREIRTNNTPSKNFKLKYWDNISSVSTK